MLEVPIIEGIHDELYSKHFKDYYPKLPYIPHMTVGKLNSEQELNDAYEYVKNTDAVFQTIVKKISVEMIGEHVANMKEFIRLRDTNPVFDEAKREGYIGIPCFVKEDGTVCFEIGEVNR